MVLHKTISVCCLTAIVSVTLLSHPAWSQIPIPAHCSLQGSPTALTGLVESLGPNIDSFVKREAQSFRSFFNIYAAIYYYDDGQAGNALATTTALQVGTSGTILLGYYLAHRIRNYAGADASLVMTGFLAHEYAHLYQIYSGYKSLLLRNMQNVKLLELHADFVAGYYLGVTRGVNISNKINAFYSSAYFLGDLDFTSPQHHGTPTERRVAVKEGYKYGMQGHHSLLEVMEYGYRMVVRIHQSNLGKLERGEWQ